MILPKIPKDRIDDLISQPNPEYEDIAIYIKEMYRAAGGDALVHRIMEEKRAEGATILTVVHHRETPLRLRRGTCDVGRYEPRNGRKRSGKACRSR